VERYEITAYESLIDMADKLGFTEVVELLEQTLHEEEATLNKLKMIASEYDVTEATEDEETASSRR
jgi:ferritin-like metal-binding protein YciE